jgi:uncharacterized surface protein with fasciclin (FAS1) repeats
MRRTSLAAALGLVLAAAPAMAADIVATAQKAGKFNTLLAAATATGLVDELQARGPLTVFAPTDAAFEALPEGTVEAFLEPGNRKKLAAIIAYHVVPARIPAADVPTRPTKVRTLNLSDAKIRAVRRGGHVLVNGVRVVQANIFTDNGVIHVIDQVLFPGELR